MASQFHALDLDSGESFLLITEHGEREWSILVDSGKKGDDQNHPLTAALKRLRGGAWHIDVCVCTHQDADHANGFMTFPDSWYASGGSIGEFWLPGRWAPAARQILLEPETFVNQLIKGSHDLAQHLTLDKDVALEQALRDFPLRGQNEPERADPESPEDGESKVAQSLGLTLGELDLARRLLEETDDAQCLLTHRMVLYWPGTMMKILSHALDTADTIFAILKSAVLRSIPVRWFDFGAFEDGGTPFGGIKGLLEPVNSLELVRPPRVPVTASELCLSLKLSRHNVESLVFLRPETETEPAALFLGDSRLAFGISSVGANFKMPLSTPQRSIVATAPHHGSRVNDNAYAVVDAWLGATGSYYVRNGGQRKQALGTYLDMPHRQCAQCFQCASRVGKEQLVSVFANGGNWSWPPLSTPC